MLEVGSPSIGAGAQIARGFQKSNLQVRLLSHVLVDLTDLIDYMVHYPNFSGIQRVQIEAFQAMQRAATVAVIPVYFEKYSKRFLAIDGSRLVNGDRRYARRLRRPRRLRKLWRKSFKHVNRWFFAVVPSDGDSVFICGAGWDLTRRTKYLASLRPRIKIFWMLYDLIPAKYPEFVHPNLTAVYCEWIDAAIAIGGTFLCISEYTKNDLLEYASQKGQAVTAITTPLAHEFLSVKPQLGARFGFLQYERFVLCVGTIEVRKNHLALVRLWGELYRTRGSRLPVLIIVGRRGWGIDPLNDYLQATGNVYGQVVIIEDANDSELSWLYQNCVFTVFPSLLEGWGLPVGESLWFGKPCVCRDNSSLPEVGAGGAIVCRSQEEFDEAIVKGIDGEFSVLPKSRSMLRTWRDVGEDISRAIAR